MDDKKFQFGGIERLCGRKGLIKLQGAHVLIVGLGGVGSWTAEALARSGVGRLTLVDPDSVCVTNINRQLMALTDVLGKPKVMVLADRFKKINPDIELLMIEDFFNDQTAKSILNTNFTFAFDGIDRLKNKVLFINECKERDIPFIISGGAGGKINPTMIQIDDLGAVYKDKLLFRVRKKLRQDYGYSKGKNKMNIPCVFSPEQTRYPHPNGGVSHIPQEGSPKKLDCHSSIGSCTHTTAIFGMMAAGEIIRKIIKE